uniref:Uncharacterized protein n=1 Tax=Cacopsylla melanoneura TaxID=428564 RepID=A0A8D8W3Z8_9HEMI
MSYSPVYNVLFQNDSQYNCTPKIPFPQLLMIRKRRKKKEYFKSHLNINHKESFSFLSLGGSSLSNARKEKEIVSSTGSVLSINTLHHFFSFGFLRHTTRCYF